MYLSPFPWLEALAVPAAFGIVARALGTVSRSGFFGGVALGAAVYYCAGWRGFTVLGLFFVIGSGLTGLGYSRKTALGVAQADRGRRGARHVLANCGVGLALALVYKLTSGNPLAGAAFAASFATAAADTAGTEVGSLYGRAAVLPHTLRRVQPGTPGAVSLQGTAAGAVAAAAVAALGWLVGLVATAALASAVFLAALAAAWLESVLGALPGTEKALGNMGKNFLNTLTGAVLCLVLAIILGLT
ncbi:MAG: DUF92 domain-containing protein [Candidatus Glassbacteria bacterium]|nr:DUF92 domain-containing protein [Candidatus Glassbacteria bacterium]